MTRSEFVKALSFLILATLLLAAALWIFIGAQAFSFYGLATCALLALPILCIFLVRRANTLSQRRWPIILVTTIAILLAILQITYWFAFFNMGLDGLPLAIAREMIPQIAKQILNWSPVALGLILLWFISRALRA